MAVHAALLPALDGLAYGLLLYLIAGGLALAYGVGGVLNLAVGAQVALGAYLGAQVSDGTVANLLLGAGAGAAAGAASGAVLAGLTAPLIRRGQLPQALATWGAGLLITATLSASSGGQEQPVRLPPGLDHAVQVLGVRYPLYRLVLAAAVLVVIGVGLLVLHRSRAGVLVRAAADDPQLLAGLGIRPSAVHTGMMAAAGGLAGLAGSLGGPVLGTGPGTGDTALLLSLVVVVLGGLSSLKGTALAALCVGEVQTLGVSLAPSLAPYLLYAAMALVLVVRALHQRPTGEAPRLAPGSVRSAVVRLGEVPARLTARLPRVLALRGAAGRPVLAAAAAAVAVLAAAPWLASDWVLTLLQGALALGLVAASATVVTGRLGIPALGQAAPAAAGGYATALLVTHGQEVGPLQLTAAAAAGAALALATTPLLAAARGATALMISLAISELTALAAAHATALTGGSNGLSALAAPRLWWGLPPLSDRGLYWYLLAAALAATTATALVLRRAPGWLLDGIRQAEPRMRASGHPVARIVAATYTAAGALAGLGGGLLVTANGFISPDDAGYAASALALLAAVIGASRSLIGALIGAGLVIACRDGLSTFWGGSSNVLLGALFLVAGLLVTTRSPAPRATSTPTEAS
ncbi:hypothetical protein BIV57_10795 [Mangrovactinospora gilvigrisea]|uniref:ABC transporter permease n=1 Tax=Mangrovactinospora gilvigrisea TaxID=1428644 RepID=A0A1J7C7C4_9ACTN|nr:hypothetical protein [Mangrovactinospora gilvigrisea]OIV37448.1 hypothetical protein BIV57_10795 [Mangrovactinospora gilvigrisea]